MKGSLHNFYRTSNDGFSLLEMLVTVAIIGIIAAISAPNLLGLFDHSRVIDSMSVINSAIKESQRQAIRLGKRCRVNIDPDTNRVSGNPTDCLLRERNINNFQMITAISKVKLNFSIFKN